MKSVLMVLSLLMSLQFMAQPVLITPRPVKITQPKMTGKFTINNQTRIVLHGTGHENSISFLTDYLKNQYEITLSVRKDTLSFKNAIHLNYSRMDHPVPGAYTLEVNTKRHFY